MINPGPFTTRLWDASLPDPPTATSDYQGTAFFEQILPFRVTRLDTHGVRLDTHGARLDTHGARLDTLGARLDTLGARLAGSTRPNT
jgi:hypothetical protein